MRKGDTTRAAILEQASLIASRVGVEGLTIGTLADSLGLSKSGLFAHFRSREALQVQVLEHLAARFVEHVVKPGLKAPRGEPRVRALFENMIEWPTREEFPGGCPFLAAVLELENRDGPARDLLVQQQKDWHDVVATVARTGVSEGHFDPSTDVEQFAYEFCGIEFSHHHATFLLRDPKAMMRARTAFESLIDRSRPRKM